MKKILTSVFFLCVFIASMSCSKETIDETGFGIVKGKVVKEEDFTPMANVKISASPSASVVYTDSSGVFYMQNVPNGQYSFSAQKDGYVVKFIGASVNINATTELVFELKKLTTVNNPPTAPVLTAPVDNAINQPLSVNLTWTSTDPENNPLKYTITLRNDKDSNVVTIPDITTTSYTLTNLNYATKYYWQVSVSDDTNPPVLSAVSTFTTAIFPNARFLFTRVVNGNNVVFTANDTGNELQITPSASNCYRPKRNTQINRVAFIKTDGSQEHIYTMKPDGTDVLRITNSVPIAGFKMEYVSYSWSGNGSQLIYPNFDKLFRINADASGLTQIYQAPSGRFISECEWSVDGTLIALKTNDINGYNAEIIIIDPSGTVLNTVLTGVTGAVGSLHFSVNKQRLLYTRDISGFQSPDYRQLNSSIFEYSFLTNTSTLLNVGKPLGTNDIDVRYSPNEAELIFMNTSNDGVSTRFIQRFTFGNATSRTTLYTNGFMPDWK